MQYFPSRESEKRNLSHSVSKLIREGRAMVICLTQEPPVDEGFSLLKERKRKRLSLQDSFSQDPGGKRQASTLKYLSRKKREST